MAEENWYRGHTSLAKYDGSQSSHWFGYTCGHCGHGISGAVVVLSPANPNHIQWLWCTNCGEPSARDSKGNIYPGQGFGFSVEGLPSEVNEAYEEARRCTSINAFTATELVCRKILMHVAVDKGAKEGDTFSNYLDHLEQKGYITPPMKGWVDLIRQHGNEATHRLASPDRHRAEGTLTFTGELLRIVYEMEHKASMYTAPPPELAESESQNI